MKHDREIWEAAAQAVREAVIEECAKRADRAGYSHTAGLDQHIASAIAEVADMLRALKAKK